VGLREEFYFEGWSILIKGGGEGPGDKIIVSSDGAGIKDTGLVELRGGRSPHGSRGESNFFVISGGVGVII